MKLILEFKPDGEVVAAASKPDVSLGQILGLLALAQRKLQDLGIREALTAEPAAPVLLPGPGLREALLRNRTRG